MSSPVLKLPAYKVLLNQLFNAKGITNSEDNAFNQWIVAFKCKPEIMQKHTSNMLNTIVTIANVWIQGRILFVEEDSLVISDGTGMALIVGLSKLPQSTLNLTCNRYVMVIGHILNIGPLSLTSSKYGLPKDTNLCAKLKAIKVTDISGSINCRSGDWWNKEVLHAQSVVVLSQTEK